MQPTFKRVLPIFLCATLAVAGPARADFIDLWANKTDSPSAKAPKKGKSKLLVIPVEITFSGPNGAFPAVDRAKLEAFFTPAAVDTRAFTFPSYFRVASSGRFQGDVTIAPTVTYEGCPVSLAGSATCNVPRGDLTALTHGMDFVRDVFRKVHDEGKIDFRDFDTNGLWNDPDGTADGVMMLVNIPGVGIAFPISFVNSGSNLAGGTGGPLILDGIKIPYVAIGGVTYFNGEAHLETVIVHEFGHVLGLADLYFEHPMMNDPYPEFQGLHYSAMGDWNYDDGAILPDAESRRALGWQDQYVVSGKKTLRLDPAAKGGISVKLGMMSDGRKEYFLVENRGPVGDLDKGIQDSNGNPVWGLSVYHVDWSKGPKPEAGTFAQRLLTCLDCDPWHPFIRNLESAGHFGLIYSGPMDGHKTSGIADDQILYGTGSSLKSLGRAGVLGKDNRYTATNYYDGTESGIAISDVQVNEDHSITATFTAPVVGNPCTDVTCAPLEQCVTSGPTAGSCALIGDLPTDGGLPMKPPTELIDGGSGCTTASGTTSGLLWALPLLALLGFAVRRKGTS